MFGFPGILGFLGVSGVWDFGVFRGFWVFGVFSCVIEVLGVFGFCVVLLRVL